MAKFQVTMDHRFTDIWQAEDMTELLLNIRDSCVAEHIPEPRKLFIQQLEEEHD